MLSSRSGSAASEAAEVGAKAPPPRSHGTLKSAMMLALAALTIAHEHAGWALGADAQQRAPPASQPAEGAQRQHLHSRGMELLARGDLDAARKYVERAARAGPAP